MKLRHSTSTTIAAVCNILIIVGIAIYALVPFTNAVPMNRGIFLALLAIPGVTNLVLVGLLYRDWAQLSMVKKIATMMYGWLVFWFWIFAPAYFLLVMNFDTVQLQWAIFAFIWGLPIIGGGCIVVCCVLFLPLQRFLNAGKAISKQEAKRLYQKASNFPLVVGVMQWLFCAFAFLTGETQEHLFAGLPTIEGWKNLLVGFTVSIFLAVIYYALLRGMLDPLRTALEEQGAVERHVEGSIARRVIFTSILVIVGSLLLVQLIVIKSFQNIVRDSVATTLQEDIARGRWDANTLLRAHVLADPQPAALSELTVSPPTQAYIEANASGIVDDFHDHLKLIGFFTDTQSGIKSVAVISLTDFYGPLTHTILSFAFGALFVLFVALGIAAIAATTLTRSLQVLIAAIRRLETDPKAAIPKTSTGDEIEELSIALGHFVRQSQQLDAEKDEFISVASHQLRTPLTQLQWTLNLLEEGNMEKEIRGRFPDIKTSVLHLAELIKLLLNTHRFTGPATPLSLKEIDLVQFVQNAVSKYDPLIKAKKLSVQILAPEHMPFMSDTMFLDIIIESLLSNAVEYTPEQGTITIRLAPDTETVHLSVADTGIGIPKEVHEQVFDKFMRGPNARLVKPDGTGLGLYVARQSVLRLGGLISFTSELGKGTVFMVTLPAQKIAAQNPDTPQG